MKKLMILATSACLLTTASIPMALNHTIVQKHKVMEKNLTILNNVTEDEPMSIDNFSITDGKPIGGMDIMCGSFSVDLSSLGISKTGDLAYLYSSIDLPDFIGSIRLFSYIDKTDVFSFDTSVFPYDAASYTAPKYVIIHKGETAGWAYLEGRIGVILSTKKVNNHIILTFQFYFGGYQSMTLSPTLVSFETGTRLVLRAR